MKTTAIDGLKSKLVKHPDSVKHSKGSISGELIRQLPVTGVSRETIQRVIEQEREDRIDLHEARAALAEIKRGEYYTLAEVEAELNIDKD